MSPNAPTSKVRLAFELDPSIIHHIIYSQAGSIGKAIIELLMNSVDAKATFVRLTVTKEGFVCQDDGQGFASRDDVKRYFGRFGTPHELGDATYGRFRLGRGQIMAHAETVWTSNLWRMTVDARTMGYAYDLEEIEVAQAGCGITGVWYESLSQSEWMTAVQEVRDLVKYTPITVELNGRQITRDPREERWDYEDDYAYYRIKEDGGMSIYNLGVLVRHDSNHLWGAGGLVVTKQAIALNVSRTEILRKTCTVWKLVAPRLKKLCDAFTKKLGDHRKTEAYRARQAQALLAGEDGMFQRFLKEEVITLLPGKKHVSVHEFTCQTRRYTASFAVVEDGRDVPKGEGIARERMACLVHPKTLERFSCQTGTDFLDCLNRIWEQLAQELQDPSPGDRFGEWLAHNPVPALIDFQTLKRGFKERTHLVSEKDVLDKESRRVWGSLRSVLVHYAAELTGGRKQRDGSIYGGRQFAFFLGESNVADAWTDGKSFIAIGQGIVKQLNATPLKTAGRIFSLVEHEVAHQGDSLDCGHDEAFYQRFHQLQMDYSEERQRFLHMFLTRYMTSLEMEGKHPKRNAMWWQYSAADRVGNGREKRGLPRIIEDVSTELAVTEAVSEENMALLRVVNAGLIEAGACPPPADWARVQQEALEAQIELNDRNREQRVLDEAMDREHEAFEAYEIERTRQSLAEILKIPEADIDDAAVNYFYGHELTEEWVRDTYADKPWFDYPNVVEDDQDFGYTPDDSSDDYPASVVSTQIAFGKELEALIRPGETVESLKHNAASAGFWDVPEYLRWRARDVEVAR